LLSLLTAYSHDVLERREPVEQLLAHLGVSLGDSWILYPVCIHMQLAPIIFVIFHYVEGCERGRHVCVTLLLTVEAVNEERSHCKQVSPHRHGQKSLGIENEPKMEE